MGEDGAGGVLLFFSLYKFGELRRREINGSEIVCPGTDGLVQVARVAMQMAVNVRSNRTRH